MKSKNNNKKVPYENTYVNRVLQFAREQVIEEPITGVGTDSTGTMNPYLRARVTVLESYLPSKRADIARMEKTGDKNNATYNGFVSAVSLAAEKFF